MKFVNDICTTTLEVKQSKFISYLLPYSKFDTTLESLKKENPKARHFVVAYRYLNEFNQIVEHSSDDGEPKGTSGKPTLFVLQGAELINSCVITVRYFGGTKLGTGGLVRAYSDACNMVLEEARLIEYKEEIEKKISFEYSNIRIVEYESSACGIEIIEKIFDIATMYKIKGSESDMNRFLQKMERLVHMAE
ncbi:YigZ family protein [bacterium]|nr:YigZ family protein [bacterium]MBU1990922.1 YigZ family protein [bacterium]